MKEFWDDIIEKRNGISRACDWTQMPYSPLTEEKKAEWETYRQALRDIPNNLRSHENYVSDEESNPHDGSIMDWSFPTKPQD